MRVYADSSFIGQFLAPDFASDRAASMFRRLGRPSLPFSQLHELEVTNGLKTRIFSAGASALRSIARKEAAAGIRKLHHMLAIRALSRVALDWPDALGAAVHISDGHAEKIGARSLDVLHVAIAGVLNADVFLTCDKRQARLAKQAGFSVELIGSGT
jgi:predicted nucleic acid-binding protein